MPVTQTLRNGAWRVVELITTPVVPADYLDVIAPLRNPTVLRARIEAVRPETENAVTLELRPGRNWQPHRPGQYVRLGVDVDGVRLWRAYSVSSAADRADGRFTVTVNAVKDGVVSGYLRRHARRGMIVNLDLPAGDFVLPDAKPAKALFPHRRQWHHPGDGHAAQRPAGPARRGRGPFRAHRRRRGLRC